MNLHEFERERVLAQARRCLSLSPQPITSVTCPRSPGGPQDYYSEGDYWWPNPDDPDGPYIRRDGLTNPDNFEAHRHLLRDMALQVSALAAAWRLTGDRVYTHHAAAHLRAWFVDSPTRMNPHLRYAQAIKGICTGRGIGIIDTVHLAEVAVAAETLKNSLGPDSTRIQAWFAEYLEWLTAHPYGVEERDQKNNHGAAWVLQAAAFARLTGNTAILADGRRRLKEILLPGQMAADGSFPLELARTKPYGYSIFNLDLMAGICQLLSTAEDNLWRFETSDGRGMRRGMQFLFPYLEEKSRWPFARDVMHWNGWPARQPCLFFAGLAFDERKYIALWQKLNPDPDDQEIRRNMPIRQPVLWL